MESYHRLLPFILLSLLSSSFFAVVGRPFSSCPINAIYNFGDSMSDTGNLIREGTGPAFSAIANYPYGMNFGKATGRCSDGSLMIDYFARGLGLPLVAPFLNKEADFTTGVNFAVAGATALDKSFFMEKGISLPFTNSSLDVQLQWFDEHMSSTCKSDCKGKFKNSLFFVGEIGGNDYNYALFTGRSIDEVKTFVPNVVDKIIQSAEKLIHAGAVNLVVPGNYPIGCMPSYLTLFRTNVTAAYDGNNCLCHLNSFASYHNQELQDSLATLRKQYPQVVIMYGDYYNSFLSLLGDFDKKSVLKACCGAGGGDYNYSPTASCGSNGTTVCDAPAKRLSWDGVHLTGAAYKRMTGELTFGGKTFPGNENWKKWICHKKINTS